LTNLSGGTKGLSPYDFAAIYNVTPLWEVILATMKLGAVIIPASTLLQPADLVDRVTRGQVRVVITDADGVPKFGSVPGDWTRIVVDGDAASAPGWHSYSSAFSFSGSFAPEGVTRAGDPLLLYFTSGTTALPKLVAHTQVSYPVGHLSTMYWVGIQPGDVHLNLSSPGWAKHAWSNVYAPWNAGATVLVLNYQRFSASSLLAALGSCQVTTFCAPPTVWRMLIQAELGAADVSSLRECVAAGEPLNPEVIEQVRKAWGITVRDGFGQTETTAQVGNTPGQPVRVGSMGRPLPGYAVVLIDPVSGQPGRDGEICLDLSRRPLGLMTGYLDDPSLNARDMAGGYYHTGDVATSDADGYITYVGRTDDVFKASDYRISPFELESVLIEHEAVAEAAVVPAPDPVRLAVPAKRLGDYARQPLRPDHHQCYAADDHQQSGNCKPLKCEKALCLQRRKDKYHHHQQSCQQCQQAIPNGCGWFFPSPFRGHGDSRTIRSISAGRKKLHRLSSESSITVTRSANT
jgi:acetyl-CoA synthetase